MSVRLDRSAFQRGWFGWWSGSSNRSRSHNGSGRRSSIRRRGSQDGPLDRESLNADLAALVDGQQRVYGCGIESLAGQPFDDLQRLLGRVRLLIWAVGGERVESVGDSDDAGQHGNLISLEAVRISAAVEGFVVQLDAGEHFGKLGDGTQNVGTLRRVRLHHFEFFFGERSWFFQDVIFDADFAHVVELG